MYSCLNMVPARSPGFTQESPSIIIHVRGVFFSFALGLCIVSMIRYDTYRRYIDPIHDMYRDTYCIIYSIKNIAETVIKT